MRRRRKSRWTNVWLNAEDDGSNERSFFEQNIADTVIHLSTEEIHGGGHRYIEIRKSRLQREQRGQHPFAIETGSGIQIFPSSGAFSDRIRSRSAKIPIKPTHFGVQTFDDVLGRNAVCEGDIIVLHGPAGCFKTQLGLQFLAYGEAEVDERRQGLRKEARSLLFVAGDSEIGLRQLVKGCVQSGPKTMPIEVCSLPDGQVHPGQILQVIERELTRRRHDGMSVDRVLFSNTMHWEMSCPFLREDEIFGTQCSSCCGGKMSPLSSSVLLK